MQETTDDEPQVGVVATFRSVWRHRRWRWLAGSMVLSLFGDFLYWIAIAVYLTDGPNGAAWLSISLLARLLPYVVLGPLGGAIADRVDRRMILVGADVGRGVLFVGVAAVIATDGPRLAVVLVLAVIASLGALHAPARSAAIPQLVPESDLAAANAAEAGLAQLSWFVGPAAGAALATVLEPGAVILVDAATFFASALMCTQLGRLIPFSAGGDADDGDDDEGTSLVRSMVNDIASGAGLVFRQRGVRGLVVLNALVTTVFGAEQILYVLVAADRLDLGAEGVGYLLAAMGVGGILATPVSARISNSPRIGRLFVVVAVLLGIPMLGIAVTDLVVVVFAFAVVEGAAAVVFDVVWTTLMQRSVPEASMGRVFSLSDAVQTLGQTIGSIGAPVLVAAVGLSAALGVSASTLLVAVVVLAPAVLALAAQTDSERRRLAATTAFLARVPELAAFERVDIERLARATTPRTVAAGTDVITAGDRPDDLYVVRSGELGVVVPGGRPDGTEPPDLTPGDLFGEIGLLDDVPRTATVTARSDSELAVIDGKVFLAVAQPGPAT